jgi:hypothetical protein
MQTLLPGICCRRGPTSCARCLQGSSCCRCWRQERWRWTRPFLRPHRLAGRSAAYHQHALLLASEGTRMRLPLYCVTRAPPACAHAAHYNLWGRRLVLVCRSIRLRPAQGRHSRHWLVLPCSLLENTAPYGPPAIVAGMCEIGTLDLAALITHAQVLKRRHTAVADALQGRCGRKSAAAHDSHVAFSSSGPQGRDLAANFFMHTTCCKEYRWRIHARMRRAVRLVTRPNRLVVARLHAARRGRCLAHRPARGDSATRCGQLQRLAWTFLRSRRAGYPRSCCVAASIQRRRASSS